MHRLAVDALDVIVQLCIVLVVCMFQSSFCAAIQINQKPVDWLIDWLIDSGICTLQPLEKEGQNVLSRSPVFALEV